LDHLILHLTNKNPCGSIFFFENSRKHLALCICTIQKGSEHLDEMFLCLRFHVATQGRKLTKAITLYDRLALASFSEPVNASFIMDISINKKYHIPYACEKLSLSVIARAEFELDCEIVIH